MHLKVVVVIIFVVWPFAGIQSGQEVKSRLDCVSWIAGCWKMEFPRSSVEEQWMKPLGSSMIGMSRTVHDAKTVAFEFLRMVQQGDSVSYISIPSGQTETAFLMTRCADHEVVFENPAHDFPQRIIYRLIDSDSLLAAIEGLEHGAHRREEFPMKRVRCE